MSSRDARRLGLATAGDDVAYVQTLLGVVPVDGDFGPITDGAVRGYQSAYGEGVTADGIVGPKTWAALDYLEHAKASGNDRMPQDQARQDHPDRGEAARLRSMHGRIAASCRWATPLASRSALGWRRRG